MPELLEGGALLDLVQREFIGLDTEHRTADGRTRRRIYLDSAATTLMFAPAHATASTFLRHNANTHSRIHFCARAATEAYAFARARVLSFVGADPRRYVCLFVGHGATGAINRAAYYLAAYRRQAGTLVVSSMEHHSNDLPHRRVGPVARVPLTGKAPSLGTVDVDAFAALLRERPRYAAVTMASNVTGIINPIAQLSELAHSNNVPLLLDACQAIAHVPVRFQALGEPDALVFSGHKVYAPGSPGVLIIRRDMVEAAQPAELGGGMVRDVTRHEYRLAHDLAEREEAGTPNVVGAVTLSAVLEVLARIGMETIAARERRLTEHLIEALRAIAGVRLYGSTDLARHPRVGVASFNLGNLDHGWVAAVLNDYYNIALRNQCFCAQPYARALVAPELWKLDVPQDPGQAERLIRLRRGMVRASLAMYSTRADIDGLAAALTDARANAARYRKHYRCDDAGEHRHCSFSPPAAFDVVTEINALVQARLLSLAHERRESRPRRHSAGKHQAQAP